MPLHEVINNKSVLIGRETITIDGRNIKVFTYLEKRAYSRAAIGSKGVHIRLASWMSKADQQEQYKSLKQWAIQHLNKHKSLSLYKGFRTYEDGSTFEIAGKAFTILRRYHSGQKSTGKLKNGVMTLHLAEGMSPAEEQEHRSYLVARMVGNAFLPEIRRRLEELNVQHFQKAIGKVRLRNNTSNWGSCSYDGNISISTRLLFAPWPAIDYVLIHELAHLVEHNHSDRFWKQVERAMPDYRKHEIWLDKNNHLCQF
ncbi:MAG: M48 family metallopeptidase [Chitinophagales bacterium]|nr:M48 family metallopeptidase [Chitinophagales bacterium]HAE14584.1 hypothetical protein [Bacteroidota bacterium]MCB9020961.1 M48 family metallopeptidase [Chitinophagales bacterium]HAE34548.1 hypothetical protein [Bacteroidota bacterium]HQU40242.1 M48 family metallopeptidase [Chitinophagales bacterium]